MDTGLRVKIDPAEAQRGSRGVRAAIESINQSADELGRRTARAQQQSAAAHRRMQTDAQATERTFRSLRGSSISLGQAIGALGGAFSIRKIIDTADAYTLAQNRLRLYTSSAQQLASVQNALTKVANDNFIKFSSVAEVYERVAKAGAALGMTQRQVIDTTDLISKAITLSGVSAEAANAAIIQFGQGLSAGALRGDELRSVMEQTPRLAKALADGLKVPVGSLRDLGEQGKLTAETVIAALQSQSGALQEEFTKLVPTVGQALTTIGNKMSIMIGEFDAAAGVTKGLVQLMSGDFVVSMGEAGFAVRKFGTILGTTFASGEVSARIKKFFVDVVGTAAEALGGERLSTIAGLYREQYIKEIDKARTELLDQLEREEAEFRQQQELRRRAREGAELEGKVPGTAYKAPPVVDKTAEKEEERRQKFIADLRAESEELKLAAQAGENAEAVIKLYRAELEATALKGSPEFIQQTREITASIIEQTAAMEERKLQEANSDYVASLQEELRLLQMTNEERAVANNLKELNATATDEQRRQVEELTKKIQEAEERNSFYEQATIQMARNIQSHLANFLFNPWEDGLSGMASKFAETLRRMAAELLASELLKILGQYFSGLGASKGGVLGTVFGGIGSILTGGKQAAVGGTQRAGQTFMAGETGKPELVTPVQDMHVFNPRETKNILDSMVSGIGGRDRGGGKSVAPIVNVQPPKVEVPVTIANVRSEKELDDYVNSPGGQTTFINFLSRNRSALREILQG